MNLIRIGLLLLTFAFSASAAPIPRELKQDDITDFVWELLAYDHNGEEIKLAPGQYWYFDEKGGVILGSARGPLDKYVPETHFQFDYAKKTANYRINGRRNLIFTGIYVLKDNTLTICCNTADVDADIERNRPKAFEKRFKFSNWKLKRVGRK